MHIHHPDVAEVSPQDPALRIGSSLTATCTLSPELRLLSSTLYWTLNGKTLPSSTYRLLGLHALSVTIHNLNGSRQQSGDNLVCHSSDGHVLAGACLYVGSEWWWWRWGGPGWVGLGKSSKMFFIFFQCLLKNQ